MHSHKCCALIHKIMPLIACVIISVSTSYSAYIKRPKVNNNGNLTELYKSRYAKNVFLLSPSTKSRHNFSTICLHTRAR